MSDFARFKTLVQYSFCVGRDDLLERIERSVSEGNSERGAFSGLEAQIALCCINEYK